MVTTCNSLVRCRWISSCPAASAAMYRYAPCSWLTVSDLLSLSSGCDTSRLPIPISFNLLESFIHELSFTANVLAISFLVQFKPVMCFNFCVLLAVSRAQRSKHSFQSRMSMLLLLVSYLVGSVDEFPASESCLVVVDSASCRSDST